MKHLIRRPRFDGRNARNVKLKLADGASLDPFLVLLHTRLVLALKQAECAALAAKMARLAVERGTTDDVTVTVVRLPTADMAAPAVAAA